MRKKIILFDFDGVIHSYKSGWQGAKNIPDPPVPGAIEFLVNMIDSGEYDVCIYSARSCQRGGRRAIKNWLKEHFQLAVARNTPECVGWVYRSAFADPWSEEVDYATHKLIKSIKFPRTKPPAHLTIDDRAICFDGDFSSLQGKINHFEPWHGKGV